MASSPPVREKVFISYSHKDTKYFERLRVHLQPDIWFRRTVVWDDTRIPLGALWRRAIEDALASTKVAVLLVSADFLASKFIREVELPKLLSAVKSEGVTILPVLLKSCRYEAAQLADFQFVRIENKPLTPIINMDEAQQEESWTVVADAIQEALNSSPPPPQSSVYVPLQPPAMPPSTPQSSVYVPLQQEQRLPVNAPPAIVPNEEFAVLSTLEGHTASVLSLATSRDGRLLASGCSNGAIKVWSFPEGTHTDIPAHTDSIKSVVFSPDGKELISSSYDGTIKRWNLLRANELLYTFIGHTDKVTSVTISSDGKTLISGSYDGTIKRWNLSDGSLRDTLPSKALMKSLLDAFGLSVKVLAIALSPDDQTLASGNADNTIWLWSPKYRVLGGLLDKVLCIAISLDNKTLISGNKDNIILLYTLPGGELFDALEGHTGSVEAVAISPKGEIFASGSRDGTIKLWRLNSKAACVQTLEVGGTVWSLVFSQDGRLFSGSEDGKIRIWGKNQ